MSESQKEILINLIKGELKKEITEIENIEIGNYAPICGVSKVSWEIDAGTGIWLLPKKLREMSEQLFSATTQPKNRSEGEITASNIGKKDFDEIISLIRQVNELRAKENRKREEKKKEKLLANPNLFFYTCESSSGKPGAKLNRRFKGRKNGLEFYLYIPCDHPNLTNITFAGQQSNDNKINHFYLIEGFETPTKTDYHDYTDSYFYQKDIELTDNITISPYNEENSNGLPKDLEKNNVSELRKRDSFCDGCHKSFNNKALSDHSYIMQNLYWEGNEMKIEKGLLVWACQDCYLNKEQEYLQKYNDICESHFDENEEFVYRWIKKFPRSRETKKSDQSRKDNKAVINFLIRYFQEHSIKKITFENNELVITYNNNNNNEIISQENITSELQVVKDFSQKNNKREIELEELKSSINANHYQAEKPKDNTLLMVCGISGILIIGVVVGLLINKKRHKNK